jgi:hypothetical protein
VNEEQILVTRAEPSLSVKERVYTTIDKSSWGDGEWQDEPDKIQWKDEDTGLPCLVKRTAHSGAWCGYVGVPPGHPYFEVGYSDVPYELVEPHGGLTYSDHCAEGPEESSICHVPDPGEPDNVWWLGFDCAHSHDYAPASEAQNRERAEEEIAKGGTGYPWLPLYGERRTYRSLAYVRSEVRQLALQLHRQTDGATAPATKKDTP